MSDKKQTVGEAVYDLSSKTLEPTSAIELQGGMQEDYMKNLLEAVDRGYKKYDKDFYIHVETKAEKILARTLRHYYIDRVSCPTPNYDQTVYRYNREAGQVEYLWTIPDKETCEIFRENALSIVPEEKHLLKFVLDFYDGSLFRYCKKLNGEKLETPELIKG